MKGQVGEARPATKKGIIMWYMDMLRTMVLCGIGIGLFCLFLGWLQSEK